MESRWLSLFLHDVHLDSILSVVYMVRIPYFFNLVFHIAGIYRRSTYLVLVDSMKKKNECSQSARGMQRETQCNTPTDDYRFNFDSERPLVQPKFTPPLKEVSLRCEALAADVENVRPPEMNMCMDNIQAESMTQTSIHKRKLSTTSLPYTSVHMLKTLNEDTETGVDTRNVTMCLTAGRSDVLVNASRLLPSSEDNLIATGSVRNLGINDGTIVPVSRIFAQFRNIGMDDF
ncbi:hypothetical protein Tco_0597770 [Tanacetum coccineum]